MSFGSIISSSLKRERETSSDGGSCAGSVETPSGDTVRATTPTPASTLLAEVDIPEIATRADASPPGGSGGGGEWGGGN